MLLQEQWAGVFELVRPDDESILGNLIEDALSRPFFTSPARWPRVHARRVVEEDQLQLANAHLLALVQQLDQTYHTTTARVLACRVLLSEESEPPSFGTFYVLLAGGSLQLSFKGYIGLSMPVCASHDMGTVADLAFAKSQQMPLMLDSAPPLLPEAVPGTAPYRVWLSVIRV